MTLLGRIDLFESYVGSIISAVTLAAVAVDASGVTGTFTEVTSAIATTYFCCWYYRISYWRMCVGEAQVLTL